MGIRMRTEVDPMRETTRTGLLIGFLAAPFSHQAAICCCGCCDCGHVGNALALSKRRSTAVSDNPLLITSRQAAIGVRLPAVWRPSFLWPTLRNNPAARLTRGDKHNLRLGTAIQPVR